MGLGAVVALATGACGGEEGASPAPPATPEPEAPEPPEPVVPPALTLSDVSVLYPLPSSDDAPGYLSPPSLGAKGALLPLDVYEAIPTFPVQPAEGLHYGRLRLLAVRFDGCHQTAGGCEAQVRMIMQPVAPDGRAKDSALHLFYRLTEEELATLVGELRGLRALAPEVQPGPLDVHPALLAQGVEGPYGSALQELLMRYAGEENLVRVTFFLRAPPVEEVWFFGGLEREGQTLVPMDIVGVGMGNQRVISTEVEGGYDYLLTPEGLTPEDGSALFTSAAAAAATDEARRAAFASFLRVANPAIYPVAELPCAGCHIGTFVAAHNRATYAFEDAAFPGDAFESSHDLTLRGEAATTPSSLRAFGWFDFAPMIAQRTVNESAMVVDDLEARF